jgi:hypothetical protein
VGALYIKGASSTGELRWWWHVHGHDSLMMGPLLL